MPASNADKRPRTCVAVWTVFRRMALFAALFSILVPVFAASGEPAGWNPSGKESFPLFLEKLQSDWGGQVKLLSQTSWHASDSLFSLHESGRYDDGQMYLRLKNQTFFPENISLDIHYEAVFAAGDTRKAISRISGLLNGLPGFGTVVEDRQRVFDVTHTIHTGRSSILHHRLDRMSLSVQRHWGGIQLGRQAMTWGNGLIFNPMDLFNPFSPTDIARDYKIGDDMVHLQVDRFLGADAQLAYVPRRNVDSGKLKWGESSFAGKLRWILDDNEVQVMAAYHYRDWVAGLGMTGYLGDALWRTDVTWTRLRNDGNDVDDYLTWVANLDYSWVWGGKNIYGLVELYYNGLGDSDPFSALIRPEVRKRLERGEMFTLGQTYFGGMLEIEVHPLVKVPVSLIMNLEDASAVLQPRVIWDARQSVQVVVAANLYLGDHDTEFGGFDLPGTPLAIRAADGAACWVTLFF